VLEAPPDALTLCLSWYLQCCFQHREKLRQLELPSTLTLKANPAFSTPSSRPQIASAAHGSQALTTADNSTATAATAREVQLQLNQDLVAATVKLDSANRRLEVLEREKDRLNKSLEDSQVGCGWTVDATCCFVVSVSVVLSACMRPVLPSCPKPNQSIHYNKTRYLCSIPWTTPLLLTQTTLETPQDLQHIQHLKHLLCGNRCLVLTGSDSRPGAAACQCVS
jgi:hypothetical protein